MMEEPQEDLEEDTPDGDLQPSEDAAQDKKTKPPNRKRFDEEMLALTNQIKEKEAELEQVKSSGALHITKDLNVLRAEKFSKITRRKEIDAQLEKINKEIPEKMRHLNQIELSLYYKSEEKINAAIQRLEWNLKVQAFKLSEEKKIVSEIDSLRRSKKTLGHYLTLKHEIGGVRDQQRRMREERDTLYRAVSQIKAREDKLRTSASQARSSSHHLKKEIDALYETKRSMQTSFRRQKEEYNGVKEKQRKEGIKRKESLLHDKRKRIAEKEAATVPFEEEIQLCNRLIAYLGRFNSLPVSESSTDSQDDPELAEEIDDGQYVLLKKSDDDSLECSGGARKLSRRNRRSRKQYVVKQMTHTPETLSQFLTLNLEAPASTADIGDALEKLLARKAQYESDQSVSPLMSESASDAGVSATESLICEMSRQVSKTESSEGAGGGGSAADSSTAEEQILADLLRCQEDRDGLIQAADSSSELPGRGARQEREECGAVGGREEVCDSQDGTGQNSDSTVEGDSGSIESQASVYEAMSSSSSALPASSDSIGGAVGGVAFSDVASDPSVQGTSTRGATASRPSLLYSEMLNMPKPSGGPWGNQQQTSPSGFSPRDTGYAGKGRNQHMPLSLSASSPASFYQVPSTQPVSPGRGGGGKSYSLDSGGPSPTAGQGGRAANIQAKGPPARDAGSKSRDSAGPGTSRGTDAIHRRSTFSGQARNSPRGQEKGKPGLDRRETFSGPRRERYGGQGRQDPTSKKDQRESAGPRKRLAMPPFPGSDAQTDKDSASPIRPRALTHSGPALPNFPPLSASWSGIASGAVKSVARSPNSLGGPLAVSYSAIVSPQAAQSPSLSASPSEGASSNPTQRNHHSPRQQYTLSPQSEGVSSNPAQRQQHTLSPRSSVPVDWRSEASLSGETGVRQHQALSPRASAPPGSRSSHPALSPQASLPLGSPSSLPLGSPSSLPLGSPSSLPLGSPGARPPGEAVTPVVRDSSLPTQPQQSLPPTGHADLPGPAAGLEEDFPPLSLLASMPAPPRRNSSNSTFSSRSGNSATAANLQAQFPSPDMKDSPALPLQTARHQQNLVLSQTNGSISKITTTTTTAATTTTGINNNKSQQASVPLPPASLGQLASMSAVLPPQSLADAQQTAATSLQQQQQQGPSALDSVLPTDAATATATFGVGPQMVFSPPRAEPASVSQMLLPTDKTFTERWVESSRAFTSDLSSSPSGCEEDQASPESGRESTHL